MPAKAKVKAGKPKASPAKAGAGAVSVLSRIRIPSQSPGAWRRISMCQ